MHTLTVSIDSLPRTWRTTQWNGHSLSSHLPLSLSLFAPHYAFLCLPLRLRISLLLDSIWFSTAVGPSSYAFRIVSLLAWLSVCPSYRRSTFLPCPSSCPYVCLCLRVLCLTDLEAQLAKSSKRTGNNDLWYRLISSVFKINSVCLYSAICYFLAIMCVCVCRSKTASVSMWRTQATALNIQRSSMYGSRSMDKLLGQQFLTKKFNRNNSAAWVSAQEGLHPR